MAVERKKEKTKTPAELAQEETKASAGGKASEGEAKPQPARKRQSAAEGKGGAAESAKPARKRASAKGKATADNSEKAAKAAAKAAAKTATSEAAKGSEQAPAESGDQAAPARRTPAPRRRRTPRAEEPAPIRARPVVRAQAKYVRSSARKARLVIEHIRGKPIDEARAVLRHTPRGVARDLEKLLNSAIANAENNHDLVGDDLFVKEAYADEGPTLKRFRPRALGRATRIRKRTSHLTLTLTPKD
jgi:ribosomal protein L22